MKLLRTKKYLAIQVRQMRVTLHKTFGFVPMFTGSEISGGLGGLAQRAQQASRTTIWVILKKRAVGKTGLAVGPTKFAVTAPSGIDFAG
jgi:hypothetical protein